MAKKSWLDVLPPYQGGGGMINDVKKNYITYAETPTKFEAGTMANSPEVVSFLDQSINFLERVGINNILKA